MEEIYYIVCTSHYTGNNGEEDQWDSYLEVIDTQEKCLKQLEHVYKYAEMEISTSFGNYSKPEWLNEEHTKLRIHKTIRCGWIVCHWDDTFELCSDYQKNLKRISL